MVAVWRKTCMRCLWGSVRYRWSVDWEFAVETHGRNAAVTSTAAARTTAGPMLGYQALVLTKEA